MIIDVGPKFYSALTTPAYDLEVKVTDLEICVNKNVKVLRQSF